MEAIHLMNIFVLLFPLQTAVPAKMASDFFLAIVIANFYWVVHENVCALMQHWVMYHELTNDDMVVFEFFDGVSYQTFLRLFTSLHYRLFFYDNDFHFDEF